MGVNDLSFTKSPTASPIALHRTLSGDTVGVLFETDFNSAPARLNFAFAFCARGGFAVMSHHDDWDDGVDDEYDDDGEVAVQASVGAIERTV